MSATTESTTEWAITLIHAMEWDELARAALKVRMERLGWSVLKQATFGVAVYTTLEPLIASDRNRAIVVAGRLARESGLDAEVPS